MVAFVFGWRSRLAAALVVFLAAAVVAGCTASDASKRLVLLDWSGYEQPEFWRAFAEKHPDVTPEFTFFADDPEAFAKVQSGFQADLVHPNSSWVSLYVQHDLLAPIDTGKLSNWPDVMPHLARLGQVDGVQYMVPWEWGYNSILVRTDKVQEVPDSWADLWDPQYAGHVSISDSAEAAVVVASLVLGYDPYSLTDAQLAEVKQKLIELKPNLLGYWTDYTEINQQVASGDVWLAANTWPDAYVAVKAEGVPVEYIEPSEGRLGWVYGYCLLKSSANPDLAHDYLDAVLAIDSLAYMANSYAYGASNSKVLEHTDPELVAAMQLDDPNVVERTVFFRPLTEEQRARWTSLWAEVKASR